MLALHLEEFSTNFYEGILAISEITNIVRIERTIFSKTFFVHQTRKSLVYKNFAVLLYAKFAKGDRRGFMEDLSLKKTMSGILECSNFKIPKIIMPSIAKVV